MFIFQCAFTNVWRLMHAETHVSLLIKCSLMLSTFDYNWHVSTNTSNIRCYMYYRTYLINVNIFKFIFYETRLSGGL